MPWLIKFIFGLLTLVCGLYFLISLDRKFKANKEQTTFNVNFIKWLSIFCLIIAVGGGFLAKSLINYKNYDLDYVDEIMNVGGTSILFGSLAACFSLFYIRYYKEDFEQKGRAFKWIVIFILLSLLSLLTALEGISYLFSYPLVSGFNLLGKGKFLNTFNYLTKRTFDGDGLSVAFYGVIMVFSVIVVYWVCDHEFFKKYKKHGILDNLALIAFPAGVIGARIGYVIGNWNGSPTDPIENGWEYWIQEGNFIKINQGGLTILGGAIGGMIAGIIFVKLRRKYVDLRWAMDIIVPSILLAQAIGRWGNFFNHEVYGAEVNVGDWNILPTFIKYQMSTSFINGKPVGTSIYVPLFLIESLINLAGFFIIKYLIGLFVPNKLPQGTLSGCYLIWYGITRVIMEPLRDPQFNMGSNGFWSNIWAFIYIALGLLLILMFYLIDKNKAKKNG